MGMQEIRLLASVICSLVAVECCTADQVKIRFDPPEAPKYILVEGIPSNILTILQNRPADSPSWIAGVAVRVATGVKKEALLDRPAVLGFWSVQKDCLRFEPRFPFAEKVTYDVAIDLQGLTQPEKPAGKLRHYQLTTAEKPKGPPPVVTVVYPSETEIPENTLKLYVHFSAPMARGEIYSQIVLLDPQGKPVDLPFLEIDEQLWNPDATRLTLLFDPGRVKRGLKPREEAGPIMEEGKTYTLVIKKNVLSADGQPLKEEYRKTYKVLAPDSTPPDPMNWKLMIPTTKTDPLTVRFPEPLDHALLLRVLKVVDASGKEIAGLSKVSNGEREWSFQPHQAWVPGKYRLRVDPILEDRAANRINEAFEVDEFKPIPKRNERKKIIELPFEIR